MAETTEIGWTSGTFNPWWGCTRVSPACAHCYADSSSKRFGFPDLWSEGGERRLFGDSHWHEPIRWNRKAAKEGKSRLIFCASMADVFEVHPAVSGERERLWELIDKTPWLTWQLLTKRPENVAAMVPESWTTLGAPANVWLGTSIENARFSWRAEAIQEVDAPVHFLSCEPLLGSLFPSVVPNHSPAETRETLGGVGEVDARAATPGAARHVRRARGHRAPLDLDGIEWVIGGGESGPHFRDTKVEWAAELRDESKARSIPFFWKQNGGIRPKSNGKELEGAEWCEIPPLHGQLAFA